MVRLRQTWASTKEYWKANIGLPVLVLLAGLLLRYITVGWDNTMKELMPTLEWTVFPALGIGFLILLYNFVVAPYRLYEKKLSSELSIERELRNTLERQLAAKTEAEISKSLFVIENVGYEFGSPNTNGYPQSDTHRILRVNVLFHAIPARWVESLQLALLNYLIPSDWQPDSVGGDVLIPGGYLYFNIPDAIKQGKYTVKLTAYSKGEKFESNPFEIEIPK